MALKQLRIGAVTNAAQWDNGDFNSGLETTEPIKAGLPVDPNDVLRLTDVGSLVGDVVGPAGATDDNLTAFDGATGKKLKDSTLSTANVSDAISKKHTAGTDTALGAVGTKNPPIDADKALYRDSVAADVLVTSTWTQIKAFLKTYFDTLYAAIADPIKGDGTAGRVLRQTSFTFVNGTTGVSVKASTTSGWNGDTNGATDDITKGATTGNWSLSGGGSLITLLTGGIQGDVIAILSCEVTEDTTATSMRVYSYKNGTGIGIRFKMPGSVGDLDLTTLVDSGNLSVSVTYLTNA